MYKILLLIFLLPCLCGCSAANGWLSMFGYDYNKTSVVVKKGDTLYSISKKHQIPLRGLIEKNNLTAPYTLRIGQLLYFPNRIEHTVKKGDTLYSISRKYNVDSLLITRMNKLKSPYILSINQVLIIPDSYIVNNKSSTATSSPTKYKKYTSTQNKSKPVSVSRKTKFIWPVNGTVVSNFGVVGKGRRNDGINIKAKQGADIKAADKGVVAYAGNQLKGFGNLVLIKHSDGYITAYAHTDKIFVKKDQQVIRGEKIATVGSTGGVNSPQLHFEVRAGKKAVNPRLYLP